MKTIELDASGWQSEDDFYQAFLSSVGAPQWHGHNLDALVDTIRGGDINEINTPYSVVITNVSRAGEDAGRIISKFADLAADLRSDGCPIDVELRK